jgi:hypothetical protein
MGKDGWVDYQDPLVVKRCNNLKTRANAVAALRQTGTSVAARPILPWLASDLARVGSDTETGAATFNGQAKLSISDLSVLIL